MRPEFLIAHFSFGSVLMPLALAIPQRGKMPLKLKLVVLILILSLISDLLSLILIQSSLHTNIVGNIYLIIQFTLLAFVFRMQLPYQRVINITMLVSTLFCVLNFIFFQGPWVFNSVSSVVTSLILMAFCIVYLYRLLNDLPATHVHKLPMLWITFAVLMYYGGNFFLFLGKNYLTIGETGSHKLMWVLHNLLNITKNILFAVALWQSYLKMKSSTLSSSAP